MADNPVAETAEQTPGAGRHTAGGPRMNGDGSAAQIVELVQRWAAAEGHNDGLVGYPRSG